MMLTWGWLLAALAPLLGVLGAWHALLYKRDSRSALGWLTLCLLVPFGGVLLYTLFGVNRVRTQGGRLRARLPTLVEYEASAQDREPAHSAGQLPVVCRPLARVGDKAARLPCLAGNHVQPLRNGDEAYPAMAAAIRAATHEVHLATYIFGAAGAPAEVVDALIGAARRGVRVRVLLDGAGSWYSWPRVGPVLMRGGVEVAYFLPLRIWPPSLHLNLRNHRKILLVDGTLAFTGGINLADYHRVAGREAQHCVSDLHFRLEGPVVYQIGVVFAQDWEFATGHRLAVPGHPAIFPGGMWCRAIADGPNEDMDRLGLVLLGAVSAARERVGIMTPYFLPSRELIGALQAAALRGVQVRVVLPVRSNFRPLDWATRNLLWELLDHGVEVRYQASPFAHTKLFVVDGHYAQIGSANLDPRSQRLNFELNVEVYGADFNALLWREIELASDGGRPVTREEIHSRSMLVRTRDAFCGLFSPYL